MYLILTAKSRVTGESHSALAPPIATVLLRIKKYHPTRPRVTSDPCETHSPGGAAYMEVWCQIKRIQSLTVCVGERSLVVKDSEVDAIFRRLPAIVGVRLADVL